MEKRISFVLLLLLGWYGYQPVAQAFVCYSQGDTINLDNNGSGTFYVDIPPVTLNKSSLDVLLTDMGNYASCYGAADNTWQDAFKSTNLTLSPALTNLGFKGYIQYGSGAKSMSPPDVCLWPDNNCSINNAFGTYAINAKIGLSRSAGSGNWSAGMSIEPGDEVARLQTWTRNYGSGQSYNWHYGITWIFRVNAKMTIPAYTCNIVTPYDQTIVNLPSVSRADLVGNGTGRYANANKEFKFNLSCDAGTKVSVKVEGDTMTGQDTVLENKISGNPDVGIQLLYNNTTVVKPYETLKLVDSASAGQQLFSFNAYYFTKSTSVTGGLVKASATFWFDYQ